MNDEIISLLDALMDMEENIYGVGLVDSNGGIIWQTENWDLTPDGPGFIDAWNTGKSSVMIQNIKYMIVENTPERLIGTNVTGQGHIIGVTAGPAKLICYINPAIGPRDALQDIQLQAAKIGKLL